MLEFLPNGLTKYSETSVFTHETVPKNLTEDHNTKAGVWGRLVVIEGALDYVVPGPPEEIIHVLAGDYAIIEPTLIHFVRIIGPVSFRVEFYRAG